MCDIGSVKDYNTPLVTRKWLSKQYVILLEDGSLYRSIIGGFNITN